MDHNREHRTPPPLVRVMGVGRQQHRVLLHKLRDMGIGGNLGIWFHSFLSKCYHFVRLPGDSSTANPVISGVPRGTVLGLLLFRILISDIDIGVLNAKVVTFADDTRVYIDDVMGQSRKLMEKHMNV